MQLLPNFLTWTLPTAVRMLQPHLGVIRHPMPVETRRSKNHNKYIHFANWLTVTEPALYTLHFLKHLCQMDHNCWRKHKIFYCTAKRLQTDNFDTDLVKSFRSKIRYFICGKLIYHLFSLVHDNLRLLWNW